MARIPYADSDEPLLKPLVDRIVAERGEVLDIYRMLLHSPPVAEGWLGLMTAIRQQTSLPGRLRELVIIRIAHLNRAGYEAGQHVPIAQHEGATARQIEALADWERSPDIFDEQERAALALTDCMTQQIQVDKTVWDSVHAFWTEREVVDLVATIASYNMVSRFLEALEIHAQKQ